MENVWIYSLGSVVIVSLMSLIGIFTISIKTDLLRKMLIYMISFAAGALIGDAFLHLLPEIVAEYGFTLNISLAILVGIIVSFILEKFIHWRHCHLPNTKEHVHPFAWMNLFGDGIHNFIDGLIIGASYLVSIPVGIATTTAVILHEIPQEIGDFGVLLHGGFSRNKALLLNFLTALTAIFGVIISLLIGSSVPHLVTYLIPFAAGNFIYIAATDLIPELHKETNVGKSVIQLLFFLLGIGIMILLMTGEGHDHNNSDADHHEVAVAESHI